MRTRTAGFNFGPTWAQRVRRAITANRREPPQPQAHRTALARSADLGVKGSRVQISPARPNTFQPIRPSRSCIQPAFLPPSMTPSGGRCTINRHRPTSGGASGGPARQRQILEGTTWIPSDTSGDVWEEDCLRSYQSEPRTCHSRLLVIGRMSRAPMNRESLPFGV